MSDAMISALISAGATLIVAIITLSVNTLLETHKSKLAIQQNLYYKKDERLYRIYEELISIINIYPDLSPTDALEYVEYPPGYSCESFDAVLTSLDYKTKDYNEQLKNINLDRETRDNYETQIENIKYAKQEISEIRDKYYKAKKRYNCFCESDKATFDIYVGQNVKKFLVEFEVVIHNTFISGYSVGEVYNPFNNNIKIAR